MDKVLALDALGNTGAPEAITAILAALGAPEPLERNSAVRELRQMPTGAADEAINRTLLTDPSCWCARKRCSRWASGISTGT